MNLSKRSIMPVLVIPILLMSVLSNTSHAYAADSSTSASQSGGIFSGLMQFISQKFGLDQTQVKAAVGDYKEKNKQKIADNMQKREDNRLTALVKAGKITDAQKQAIITELGVLQTKYNPANFRNLTQDQRKQKFTDEQNEIKSWASGQGIDPKYVLPGFGMRMPGKIRRFDRHGGNFLSPTPTPGT
ncbi:MAG TPA: hypothetical protein VG917_00640 [Patescibacteria group bacterium]|nr:hypothetical protein [Patescibacteria group bacterium]